MADEAKSTITLHVEEVVIRVTKVEVTPEQYKALREWMKDGEVEETAHTDYHRTIDEILKLRDEAETPEMKAAAELLGLDWLSTSITWENEDGILETLAEID